MSDAMDQIALTGSVRYRTTWRGKLVLQVEESIQSYDWRGGGSYGPEFKHWRDAKITDLTLFASRDHEPINPTVA